jgi:hypothetical protein
MALAQESGDLLEIAHESCMLFVALCRIWSTQD